ncbi:hypothetical protein SELMODRAFT_98278 [Selaginella moellendorffii]|uniref:Protein DGS1, mitochondrial n=1 Tax=Selaginella moellendorffii TaxID=88036 RepID=D8RPP9_SELML|nr:hypothetical protein SELMODRAFT_98278 [Selaginella moellendorffii]
MEAFRDISMELLLLLHDIQINFQFWRARQQGSDMMRIRFMVLERGPHAFVEGLACMVRALISEGSATQKLVYDASCRITERMTMLRIIQEQLAVLLAQVYHEVDKLGDHQGRQSLCAALTNVYDAMIKLERNYDLPPVSKVVLINPWFNLFFTLPKEIMSKRDWTDEEIGMVVRCLRANLSNIKECMAFLLPLYERPKKITRFWIHYSVTALAFVVISGWIGKHSRLAGSDDLDNWIRQGAEAIKDFYQEHVEEPLLSIRDDLFETFRKRHQGSAEVGDVRLTAASLSRMLKAFAEQTSGGHLPSDATEQQMMEIMMSRYEKELTHPLQSLLGGELARALLIQVQKLKLDIETAMLELNQILRANEINFAILAAFPAVIFAVFLGYLIRVSLSKSKGAEGRGRKAQLRRRMLVAEAERAVIQYQLFKDKNEESQALWQYGMLLYALDRLYRALSKNGISKAEWFSLREDVLDLAKPNLDTHYKLLITARMGRLYECIAPVPRL